MTSFPEIDDPTVVIDGASAELGFAGPMMTVGGPPAVISLRSDPVYGAIVTSPPRHRSEAPSLVSWKRYP
ncbi:hypothetical protein N7510_000676 [Penicillium lagena]|uniref:uncharacterized protein n=1 Tax=Penicillium lagena TaxID=94218 RepID=UPI00253FCA96|nr:uncharacterized protein N7510_000676 [Penicillium lagena]KAJ5624367.1 hypothetical protein N7510_000676 [Penicillium lagena]